MIDKMGANYIYMISENRYVSKGQCFDTYDKAERMLLTYWPSCVIKLVKADKETCVYWNYHWRD